MELNKLYFGKLMRAVVEFQMIEGGDKILIGLSGGKDSLFLVYAMAYLREQLKNKFSLHAFNINPMFYKNFSSEKLSGLKRFCDELNITFSSLDVDIASIIAEQNNKNACFTCSYFRRGAINRFAKENGFNKIAYAHHNDDAVETFFMSLIYSGQLKVFSPVTYLSRMDLTVIRPLVYFHEFEIEEAAKTFNIAPIKRSCPFDGNTKRESAKKLIADLGSKINDFYPHLASAMRGNAELWPPAKNKNEMKEAYFKYINGDY